MSKKGIVIMKNFETNEINVAKLKEGFKLPIITVSNLKYLFNTRI